MSRKHLRNATGLKRSATNSDRRGFILLVVTVVIILLSLAAYGYLNSMATEHAAAAMFGRDVEARMAAESAVEYAACQIALKETDPSIDVYHNPGTFHNQAMNETDNPRGQVRCPRCSRCLTT